MRDNKPKECTYPNCDSCGFPDDCHYFGKLTKRYRKSRFDKHKSLIKQMVDDGYNNTEIAIKVTELGVTANRRQVEQYILTHDMSNANCGRRERIAKRHHAK